MRKESVHVVDMMMQRAQDGSLIPPCHQGSLDTVGEEQYQGINVSATSPPARPSRRMSVAQQDNMISRESRQPYNLNRRSPN